MSDSSGKIIMDNSGLNAMTQALMQLDVDQLRKGLSKGWSKALGTVQQKATVNLKSAAPNIRDTKKYFKKIIYKDGEGGSLNILRHPLGHIFESGTTLRTRSNGGSTGSIRASHFFSSAVNENEIYHEVEQTLDNEFKRMFSKMEGKR